MSHTNENSPELDLSYLKDISGGDAEFMIEMIDIFLDQTPMYFNQLADALKQGDWKSVGDLAHKIKPTLAFMGADTQSQDMQFIEKSARNSENIEEIPARYSSVRTVCDSLFVKLADFRDKLKSEL